ncbi:MAG TPA: hypothetical protein PKC24_04445 [Cyclobacteriaceae bacterium]|nr:hypothetical protein [Cyclobacteriaceae bacterium]
MIRLANYLLTSFLLALNYGYAQSFMTQMGARAAGMGYASSSLKDEWAIFNNPGGLSGVEKSTGAFSHDFRPAFSSANRVAALFAQPIKQAGVWGLGLYRFGDELYNEQMLSTAYSNQLGIASLGLRVNYLQLNVEGFGRRGLLGIDFGGIASLGPQLLVAASVQNINQMKVSSIDSEYMPAIMRAGVQLKAVDELLVCVELEKDISQASLFRAGIEYKLYEKFFFRSGFNLNPSSLFGGIGASMKQFKVDYAFGNNYFLGSSHQATAAIYLSRKP